MDKAKAMVQRVRKGQWNKKNKHRVPASYQEGDWVLVHQGPLPAWPRSTSADPLLLALQDPVGGWSLRHSAVFSPTRGDPGVRCSTAQALL